MSEGTFKLGESGWYTVQTAQENDFLNKRLETDQYGIYYSVKFEGDAETFLWQAKTAPVEGEKYYGHIEESKSGKSLRFKKDKVEEAKDQQGGSTQSTDESIARAVSLKAAVELVVGSGEKIFKDDKALEVADKFLAWLKGETTDNEIIDSGPHGDGANDAVNQEIDPNDIPPEFR